MKRKSSLILLTMLLTTLLLTVSASAATVCKIGSKGYSSLQKAVNAVKNGQTITVTAAIKASDIVDVANGKTFTIDFAKKKYTCSGDAYAFGIRPGTKLTVKNLNLDAEKAFAIGGTVNLMSGKISSGYIEVKNDGDSRGTLNIKGGTYNIKKKENKGPWISNDGIVRIYKGTFSQDADFQTRYKLYIAGGTFKGIGTGEHPLISSDAGQTIITGGAFTRNSEQLIISSGQEASVTIQGGTFTDKSKSRAMCNFENAKISGGTFVGGISSGGNISISGGTFKGGMDFSGKATVSGGKCGVFIVANPGADVTIKKFTINQGQNPPKEGPGLGNATLIALGGKITVQGGSYVSPNGYGYAQTDGGTVTFTAEDWQKMFKVKTLEYK